MKYRVTYISLLLIIATLPIWSQDAHIERNNESPENEETIWENINLIKKGSFEEIEANILSKLWKVEPSQTSLQIDTDVFLTGKGSLRVEGSGSVELRTFDIPIPIGAVSLTGSLAYKGDTEAVAVLRWYKGDNVLREDTFSKYPPTGEGWYRFSLSERTPPEGSSHLILSIKAELPAQGKFWIDEVNLNISVEQAKTVNILINQIGYDLACPKRFVVATNFKPQKVKGILIGADNNELAEVTFSEPKRIIGQNESDWGLWFMRGDFTPFDQEGAFKICLWIDNKKYVSDEFVLGKDLIWEKTIPIVLNGIKFHRCGMEILGIHQSCHLDDNCDGKPLIGGWHNGSNYGKDKSGLVLSLLAEAYLICSWRIKKDEALDKAFQEELNWGAKYIVSRIKDDGGVMGNIEAKSQSPDVLPEKETDGTLGNEDDRTCSGNTADIELCAYALSCLGYAFPDTTLSETFYSNAEKITISLIEKGCKGNTLFNSLVFLAEKKGYEKHLPYLNSLYPEDLINSIETIPRYDSVSGGFGTFNLSQVVKKAIEEYIKLAEENPFGLCPINLMGSYSYLILDKESKPKGINGHILTIAQLAGKAFKFYPDNSVRALFFDQINWLLGVNPFGISMIKGIGNKQVSILVHPYIKAGVNPEQMIGCIPYGIRAFSEELDIPYIDLAISPHGDDSSLGVSIETMALYINAVAQYYRVRVHGGETEKGLSLPSNK